MFWLFVFVSFFDDGKCWDSAGSWCSFALCGACANSIFDNGPTILSYGSCWAILDYFGGVLACIIFIMDLGICWSTQAVCITSRAGRFILSISQIALPKDVKMDNAHLHVWFVIEWTVPQLMDQDLTCTGLTALCSTQTFVYLVNAFGSTPQGGVASP